MKKTLFLIAIIIMAIKTNAQCTLDPVTFSATYMSNVTTDLYYKPVGATTQRYHLINVTTKSGQFACKGTNLSAPSSSWSTIPISSPPFLQYISRDESLINPLSYDTGQDGKVDKVLYFGTHHIYGVTNPDQYTNTIHLLELVRTGLTIKAKFTKLKPVLPYSPGLLKGIIHHGNSIYIMGGADGKTLHKMELTKLLSTSIAYTWDGVTNSLPTTANSNLFKAQGNICVVGNDTKIYKLNGTIWNALTSSNPLLMPNTNYSTLKYRHGGDIILYNLTNSDTYILDEYTYTVTDWYSRYTDADRSANAKMFFADYTYYMCYSGTIDRYSLPKPKFDLIASPTNKLIYEEDNFYLSGIGTNQILLKGYNQGCGNTNYFIGIASCSSSNVWVNIGIPSLEKWITDATSINAINAGTFDLRAWMVANHPTLNTAPGTSYKVTIAVGNPWMSRPAIITF